MPLSEKDKEILLSQSGSKTSAEWVDFLIINILKSKFMIFVIKIVKNLKNFQKLKKVLFSPKMLENIISIKIISKHGVLIWPIF